MRKVIVFALLLGLLSVFAACSTTETTDDSNSGVDHDLTGMSATMLFGQVFDILHNSENYYESTIRLEGEFEVLVNAVSDESVYTLIVEDEGGCCAQWLRLKMAEGVDIDIPEAGAAVLLEGKVVAAEDASDENDIYIEISSLQTAKPN